MLHGVMILKIGSKGYKVAQLQQELNERGEKLIVNGIYDVLTAEAVARFQNSNGLEGTGNADDAVLTKLEGAWQDFPETTKDRVVLVSPINGFDGYGFHGSQIATDLIELGYDVRIRALSDERTVVGARVPDFLKRRFIYETQPDPWELVLWPPDASRPCTPGKKTIYFTMWESTRIPKESVNILNQAECVVVPCEWNAQLFSACGVTAPIRVCQLGIFTDKFKFSPMRMDGPTVFGAAGRLAHGGMRKGLDTVIEAFQKAFPLDGHDNVRLRIKCFPDCRLHAPKDHRIQLTAALLSWDEMAQWMAGLTAFVSASRGEGFGLLQIQALASGRPLVAVPFSGMTEYFSEEVGYPVRYKLTKAEGVYKNCGHYAQPSVNDLADQMRAINRDRLMAQRKGALAAIRCTDFSWKNANLKLLKVMKEFGMVKM